MKYQNENNVKKKSLPQRPKLMRSRSQTPGGSPGAQPPEAPRF